MRLDSTLQHYVDSLFVFVFGFTALCSEKKGYIVRLYDQSIRIISLLKCGPVQGKSQAWVVVISVDLLGEKYRVLSLT